MSEPDYEVEETMTDAEGSRDPGSSVDAEGVPDVADDSTPGSGAVDEPEVPVTPVEAPTAAEDYGTTEWEQTHPEGIDERVAQEQPEQNVLEDYETELPDGRSPENAALRVDEDPDSDAGTGP